MIDQSECALKGWEEIRRFVGAQTIQPLFRQRQEMLQAGAIFYRVQGSPPRKNVYAFPTLLRRYIVTSAGEMMAEKAARKAKTGKTYGNRKVPWCKK